MQPWPPDGSEEFFGEDSDNAERPVALVSTQSGVPLRVEAVEDEQTPEDMVCMGTLFKDRLIARSAVPPELLADLETRNVFQSPVRLGLAAFEEHPGIQCRLFALLPANAFTDEEPEEPWAASVPRFEDSAHETKEQEENTVVPLLLGHIVRFTKDRKHPDDLPAEAVDVLRTILSDDGSLHNVVDKVLDDLLD